MKKRKILAIGLIVIIFAIVLWMSYYICEPILKMAKDPTQFQEFVKSKGIKGILTFMVAMTLQVIAAIIPGGPFEIAAGYAFGTIKGAIIADIAMTIGSVIVFLFVKKFGMYFVELFVSKEKVESLSFLKSSKKTELILFMLFLIPGTPKDLISYAVGLTDIKLLTWIFITFVGRFPAILLSTLGGSAAVEKNYFAFIILIIVILILGAIGGYWYKKWHKSHAADKESENDTDSKCGGD